MRMLSVALLMCTVTLLTVAGCTKADSGEPELVPVSGTVTLDGKPLADAAVVFGGVGRGATDQNGHYDLKYKGDKPGIPPGEYRVVCDKWVMADGTHYKGEESPELAGAKPLLPPRYSDEASSELKATVLPGGGTIDFPLTSK